MGRNEQRHPPSYSPFTVICTLRSLLRKCAYFPKRTAHVHAVHASSSSQFEGYPVLQVLFPCTQACIHVNCYSTMSILAP